MGGERAPVEDIVVARDREAGIVERERGVADVGVRDEFRTPFDLLVEEARVLAVKEIKACGICGTVASEQALRLPLVGGKRRPKGNGLQVHPTTISPPIKKNMRRKTQNPVMELQCSFRWVMFERRARKPRECAANAQAA